MMKIKCQNLVGISKLIYMPLLMCIDLHMIMNDNIHKNKN
jgi:hypothetical protein